MTRKGSKVAVIGLGTFYGLAGQAADLIGEKTGTVPTVINPYYITGLDEELLKELKKIMISWSRWKMESSMVDLERRSHVSMATVT